MLHVGCVDATTNVDKKWRLSADTLVIAAPGESSGASGVNPANGQVDNTGEGVGAVYVFR